MAHVGVKRLGPGHRQKDRAKHDHAKRAVMQQEVQRMHGVQRCQHLGRLHHPVNPARRHDQKPDQHDRAEKTGDRLGPAVLDQKQQEDDGNGRWHDEAVKAGRDQLQPLKRRQHRNGGRDRRIAVKQRRPDHADDQHRKVRPAHGALHQRQQRQGAALALVVGAQQDQDVFHRHHQHQRPDDQRQDAQHILALDAAMAGAGGMHRLAEGIKRRGADIAIDHANGGQRQRKQPGALMGLQIMVGVMVGVCSLRIRDLAVQTGHMHHSLHRIRPGRWLTCRKAA